MRHFIGRQDTRARTKTENQTSIYLNPKCTLARLRGPGRGQGLQACTFLREQVLSLGRLGDSSASAHGCYPLGLGERVSLGLAG